ncbi:MAG: hypothetical protein AAF849_09195 [Bacteroidota bacterium]
MLTKNSLKYLLKVIVFTILLCACSDRKTKDYQAGFDHCTAIFNKNGGEGLYPEPKCLEGYRLPIFSVIKNRQDTIGTNS